MSAWPRKSRFGVIREGRGWRCGGQQRKLNQQFASNEMVRAPWMVLRLDGLPKRRAERYLRMKHRVLAILRIA